MIAVSDSINSVSFLNQVIVIGDGLETKLQWKEISSPSLMLIFSIFVGNLGTSSNIYL